MTPFILAAVVGITWVLGSFVLGQLGADGDGDGGHGGGSDGHAASGPADAHGDVHGDADGDAHGDAEHGGHDHTHPHHGFLADLPLFTPTAFAFLLIGFGLAGTTGVEWLGLAGGSLWALALLSGTLGWGAAAKGMQVLQRLGDGGRSVVAARFRGEEAAVLVGVPDGGRGEISFESQGEFHAGPARAAPGESYRPGDRVTIVGLDPDGCFVVGPTLAALLRVEAEADTTEGEVPAGAVPHKEGQST